MPNYSPYAEPENGAPEWKVGERESAIVFLSLTIYLILDVNVGIYRVFRRKQGLYYWSLIFATWGTAVVAVGNILKNLKPEWGVIWPLWTLMIQGGWSIYAPAECLILYSRLHLVNQNERLHRWLLYMIIVGSFAVIVPNWVFVFGAYDINDKVSSIWSPRMAIIDRVSQACFTVFESVISGIYIHSLIGILRTKVNMRTRRVMRDLICVNVAVILMDFLVIILIFINQANLAYPLQDLTYAFKFKIEFAVLNQLMAVASVGARRTRRIPTFEEKRYRRPGHTTMLTGYSDDDIQGVRLPFLSLTSRSGYGRSKPQMNEKGEQTSPIRSPAVTVPAPVLSTDHSNMSGVTQAYRPHDGTTTPNAFDFGLAPDLKLESPMLSSNNSTRMDSVETSTKPDPSALHMKDSDDTLLAPVADDENSLTLVPDASPSVPQAQAAQPNRLSLRSMLFGRNKKVAQQARTEQIAEQIVPAAQHQANQGTSAAAAPTSGATGTNTGTPMATSTGLDATASNIPRPMWSDPPSTDSDMPQTRYSRRQPLKHSDEDEDTDSDNDGVHAWERRARDVLRVPWFPAVKGQP